MSEEKYHYFRESIEIRVLRRTRHPQSLSPWISSSTSKLLKKTGDGRSTVTGETNLLQENQKSVLSECAENDRLA